MKLLLVEDEASAARRLCRLVQNHKPGTELVHATDGGEAIARLKSEHFDGVLLDLSLAGSDGFDVMRALDGLPVIVVSAHVHRSIEAFDHAVLDFVPKPVVQARLAKALDRLSALATIVRPATLIVRSAGKADIVACDRIVRIQGADDYVELILLDRRLLHDTSLATLERRLPPHFLRIHRSHIVNGDMVVAIVRTNAGPVAMLANGDRVPISRRRAGQVQRMLLPSG